MNVWSRRFGHSPTGLRGSAQQDSTNEDISALTVVRGTAQQDSINEDTSALTVVRETAQLNVIAAESTDQLTDGVSVEKTNQPIVKAEDNKVDEFS